VAASEDIQKRVVNAWGIDIEVRALTAKLWDDMLEREGGQMKSDTRAKLIIASCYEPETGKKVFRVEDIDMLNGKSALETGKLLTAIYDLNGMSAESRAELKKDSSPEEGDTSA
jgi:hypothetical protein